MAAERMNADVRDVWFLDDNIHSISTGKKAGMMTCGVYDDSSSDTVDEMKRVCHRYIYNFTELL